MRLTDGRVEYIDIDEYLALFDGSTEDTIEISPFTPDLISFFDQYVLGAHYPELMRVLLGEDAANGRHRKTGELHDSWRRLLIAAGLST